MNPPPVPAPTPGQFKDRIEGLRTFGFLTALFGILCAFPVISIIWKFLLPSVANPFEDTRHTGHAHSSVETQTELAVVFIWLGIGSMMARRWARSLLMILAWASVVAVGLSVLPLLAEALASITYPRDSIQPHESLPESIVGTSLFLLIAVVRPVLWARFYSNGEVRATCEARDPIARWTDRAPAPVLALSMVLTFVCFSSFSIALTDRTRTPFPFWGLVFPAAFGTAMEVVMVLLTGYCAWGCYKLKRHAWWITTTGVIISFFPSTILWQSLLLMAIPLGYLIYLRRYFFRPVKSVDR